MNDEFKGVPLVLHRYEYLHGKRGIPTSSFILPFPSSLT